MDYINKSKDELIAEIELLKAENARLNINFDKQIHEIEAVNKSIFEASPDDITITDLAGNIIFVTPMALSIFRYDKVEQIIGRNLIEFVVPEEREYAREGFERMKDGKPKCAEHKAIRGDGSIFDIEVNGQFIKDNKNNPTKMIFIVRDISERKQAENNIKENEEKFRQILESQNEGIGLVNENEVFVFANPAANRIFETDNLIAKSLYEFLTPLQIEKIINQTANRKKGDSNIYELEITTPKGNVKYLSVSSEPKKTKNGEYEGAYAVFSDITKRVEAEKEMLKFKAIADQANYGAVITNLDGTFLYVNNALSTMMGWDENQLIGKSINIIHNEDQSSSVSEIFELLKTKGGFASKEINHARKDGSVFPTLMSAKVIRDQNDKAEFVSCTLNDISHRKKAEENIKAKTAILTNLIINLKEGIVLENAARKIELTNQLFCNMFGIDISPEALLGSDYSMADEQNKMLFKNPDKFVSDSRQIVAKREPVFNNELQLVDGRYFERDFIPTYIDEKYTGHLWKYRDITEKKKAEIELLKISQAIEQSPIMTIITDTKGIIEYVNPSTLRTTGYSKEELIGKYTAIFNSQQYPHTDFQELWATIKAGNQYKGEFHNKKKNGEFYWAGALVVPIFDNNNNIVNFISINEDITERKKIEQELIDLNKNLEQKVEVRTLQLHNANKAKSEFLSRMSHELRTPMNSILGFAQLLEMGELNTSQRRGVNHIINSGKHLLYLINQVLDIARIEAGRLQISIEPLKINAIIKEMIDITNPLAAKNQIDVKFIETETNQLAVKVDRPSFKQILLNLLNNAIKYNKENGKIEIKTEIANNNNNNNNYHNNNGNEAFIRISISDTGVGINQADISKLFMPFERISAYNSQIEGTGLGLSVVKKLVEAMGGTCGVESEIGVGSTFWFELPQALNPTNLSIEIKENTIEIESKFDKPGTILYIEDNTSNIELLNQIISTKCPQIKLITNNTGKETVALAVKYKPELILLDLNLPDISGNEILKLILANERIKNIPVVILSADSLQHQIDNLKNVGAKEFLTKPFEINELLRVIDKYM